MQTLKSLISLSLLSYFSMTRRPNQAGHFVTHVTQTKYFIYMIEIFQVPLSCFFSNADTIARQI